MSHIEKLATVVQISGGSGNPKDEVPIYRCKQDWSALKETNSPDIKFCDRCSRSVFRAKDIDGFQQLSASGQCVWVNSHRPTMGLGVRPQVQHRRGLGKILSWLDDLI